MVIRFDEYSTTEALTRAIRNLNFSATPINNRYNISGGLRFARTVAFTPATVTVSTAAYSNVGISLKELGVTGSDDEVFEILYKD